MSERVASCGSLYDSTSLLLQYCNNGELLLHSSPTHNRELARFMFFSSVSPLKDDWDVSAIESQTASVDRREEEEEEEISLELVFGKCMHRAAKLETLC